MSLSVIIPAYQAEPFLADAIASVLAQSVKADDVIVVDDGSTDGTVAVARGFGAAIRLMQVAHGGLGATRNRGIEASSGSLLAFLDADDLWPPDSVAARLAALEADPGMEASFGHIVQFREDVASGIDESGPEAGHFASSMLIRRDAFLRVGMFATRWTLGEFIDWYARALECRLRSVMLPDVVLRRRIHGENLGVRHRQSRGDYLRILKAALDRRRPHRAEVLDRAPAVLSNQCGAGIARYNSRRRGVHGR